MATVAPGDDPPRLKAYEGMPPEIEPGAVRVALPSPRFVLLDHTEAGWFVVRFDEVGDFIADTWHPTKDEAIDQASWEFGDRISEWDEIPAPLRDSVDATLAFAMTRLREATLRH